jgi:hypothetical protein
MPETGFPKLAYKTKGYKLPETSQKYGRNRFNHCNRKWPRAYTVIIIIHILFCPFRMPHNILLIVKNYTILHSLH